MNNFEILTSYISKIHPDNIGKWVFDTTNDGSPEHPFQMPFIDYSEIIISFIDDLMAFCDEHPEYEHTSYNETLTSMGIQWSIESMSSADVSIIDEKGIIALLVGAVRADRFCEGALKTFFKNGSIIKWLNRLNEIE